jgi:hypothetical protein
MECIVSILPKRTGNASENNAGCIAKFAATPFIRIEIAPAVQPWIIISALPPRLMGI